MRVAVVGALAVALTSISATMCFGRLWTDSSGHYTLEADMVASNDRMVVLQRANRELGAVSLAELSEDDRKFVAKQRANDDGRHEPNDLQTWTLRDGTKVVGRIVDYARRDVTLQARRGRTYVNDRVFENLPEFYQQLLPTIVAHYEDLPRSDRRTLRNWLARQRGAPRTLRVEGVVLELKDGDEFALPFFLFSDDDQRLLKAGWQDWLAQLEAKDFGGQSDIAFLLQTLAEARQRDARVKREIAMMQLNFQAVQAGLVSLWEVTLHPAAGQWGRSQWVVVAARDSREATEAALKQFPGYFAGPVRRVAGR